MTSPAPRAEAVLIVAEYLLACPACSQEMYSPNDTLPLHMAQGALCKGSGTEGADSRGGTQIVEPLTIPDVGALSVSEVLAADTCLSCGGSKPAGNTLCTTCHGFLPFVLKKALPDHIKGYLFSDEHRKVAGHYTKKEFMGVFQQALAALAEVRSAQVAVRNGATSGRSL